jgi:hypothetical protein
MEKKAGAYLVVERITKIKLSIPILRACFQAQVLLFQALTA